VAGDSSPVPAQQGVGGGEEAQITWDRAGPAFEGRIAELEARVAELEEPFGTLDVFVDCDAGETIGAALAEADTHLGQVNITISGVCEESVNVGRDDVSLSGVNRSDGIRGSSHVGQGGAVDVNGARRVSLSNMTISSGVFGIVLGGADVGVSGVTVRDTSLTGMFVQVGSILNVDDSLIVENAGSGIEAQTESIIVLANSEVSHNGGTGIGAGSATVSVNNSEIVDNQDGGAGVGNGGNLDLGSTLVANNRGFAGVVSRGGQLGMGGDTRIVGNEGGGSRSRSGRASTSAPILCGWKTTAEPALPSLTTRL
jgi:hypothetical protein